MARVLRPRADRILLALSACVAAALSSCSEKPAEPQFDNPFDPALGIDLLAPRAVFRNHTVVVTWNHVLADDLGEEVTGYILSRSRKPTTDFVQAATLTESAPENGDDDSPGVRTSADASYVPDAINYYGVGFTTESGREVLAPGVPVTTITLPPRVRLQVAATKTAARYVTLRLQSASSTRMHVSSEPTFGSFTLADTFTTTGGLNETLLDWDLGPADASGDTLRVYARSLHDGGIFSAVDTLVLEVEFQPQLELVETVIIVPDVTLEVPIVGISRMRFAGTEQDLAAAPWIEPGATDPQQIPFTLSAATDSPEVWAEYESDFGFAVVVSTAVTTAEVSTPTMTLNDGALFTTDRVVTVISDVSNASVMRFSETADFSGVPWIAFADMTSVELSGTPGRKTLYGWFANAFDTTGQAASAEIVLVGEGTP